MINKVYDRLTVIKFSHKDKHGFKVWECKCECGTICYRTTNNLNRRPEMGKHCGCKRYEKHPDSPYKSIIRYYKTNAKKRDINFNLSIAEVKSIVTKDCHYCGAKPSNTLRRHNEGFKYSGIDRVDNKKGYTLDNCIPCCMICNRMKKGIDYETFINQCKRIANHSRR